MKSLKKFAAFILTHARSDRVLTYNTLRRSGYTGRIELIVDDLDPELDRYLLNFPGQVQVFSKKEIAQHFDAADNFHDTRTIIYARNASFDIARRLNLDAFVQLDDDYKTFEYRWADGINYDAATQVADLDPIFLAMISYLEKTPLHSIAFAQGGDYIGGAASPFGCTPTRIRKIMNSFFCLTKRRFYFQGRINEDVNTYVEMPGRGFLFLTIPNVLLTQIQTQSNPGGMADMYRETGTYLKSFYPILFQPSSVKIAMMGDRHRRLHHAVRWASTVPMILSENVRKQNANKT